MGKKSWAMSNKHNIIEQMLQIFSSQDKAYGTINHCIFPIHTSRLEGINNKVKVIKRKAYGFYDIEYFS